MLDEWGCKLNDAILAEDKHRPLYAKLAETHPVEYIAGGATQNSVRVAQWVMGSPGATAFVGCVGTDKFGDQLESAARADGVNVQYMKQGEVETGTCAVLVKGGERSLCANLAAANKYDKSHYDSEGIQALVEAAKVYYSAGFFLTVSPATMVAIGEHSAANNKTFCVNLSAPFIPQARVPPFLPRARLPPPRPAPAHPDPTPSQFFKDPLAEVLAYADFVFGNESEAAIHGKEQGWGEDVATVALKVAAMPKKSGSRPRVVVFTQGKDPTLVACGGVVNSYPVPPLSDDMLVDTNGAGDAFVGGFIAMLAKGSDLAACVNAGHYSARQIIQVSGCKIPSFAAQP